MNQLALKFIDLTHEITPNSPTWDGHCGFKYHVTHNYHDDENEPFRIQEIAMRAGIGTHIDAPSHVIDGGLNVSELGLNQLIAPVYVIDVSDKAHENYLLTVDDIKEAENHFGEVTKKSFVIIHTGWEKFWHDKRKYHNNSQFPVVSIKACEYLLEKDIVGLGIDTLSADRPESHYPVHKAVLGQGKYLVENVANAKKLPKKGAYTLVMPIKAKNLTESPVRLIGLLAHLQA